MKPIIITILTLFILGECFSQNVQSNNSFIFQPTTNPVTTFRIKGIFSSDSAIYLPIRENNWTPTRSGAIQFSPTLSALTYWNADSAKWLLVGSGGGSPSSLATLSPGYGLIGVTYDPLSTNQTWLVDTSKLLTINNFLTNYFDTSSSTTATFFNVVSISNDPPTSPLDSSYYLVGTAPTGIWITHENQVAQRLGTGWAYTTPEISQTLTDISTQTIYIWNGTEWIPQKFAILGQLNPQDVDLRVGSIPNKALNFYTDSTLRMGIAADGGISFPAFNDLSTDYTVQFVLKNNLLDTVHARNLVAVSPLSLSNDTLYCVGCTGGGSLLLQTNGVDNGSQTKLNLVAGTNVTLADNGTGNVTINASGGSGSVDYVKSGVGILVDSTGRNYTVNVDTNLISTRAWRQKGIDSVVSLIPTVTPAALTKTDDANVTLTLGGTPATSLLQATSLTLGWTGVLSIARGGTNNGSLSVTNGNLLYTDGSKVVGLGVGTAGQHLLGGTLPHWADTTAATSGTVTSVAMTGDNVIYNTSVTGSPITSSGTLAPTLKSQSQNLVLASPNGSSGTPTFRQVVNADITNATIVASTKLSATGTPSATTYLRGDDTWATVSAGGGGADTTHFVTPGVLYKDSAYSDTKMLQRGSDVARVSGKTLYIAKNYKTNSFTWSIDSAILIYSNCNWIIDGAKLKKSDSCRDNIIRTANCGYGITTAASNLDTNISIVSYGGVIEGADNPRSSGDYLKTLSLTPTIVNGFTYGTDVGKTGRSQTGDWRNYGIILAYSKRIIVSGLIISNMEAYGISFERCRNVWVDNISADMNGYANGDTTRRLLNEGTLDFDQSINNITVTNCRGFSQDDFLANNIVNNDSTAGHYGYYAIGDTSNAARDSISNVFVSNIYVGSNANTYRVLIPPNSIHANNITLTNITNSLKSTDPFYGRTNGTQASAIQIGATNTGFYGGNVPFGNWSNITVDNIRSYNTTYLLRIQNRIQDSYFNNLKKTGDLTITPVYYDGSFADHLRVNVTNEIDSSKITMAQMSGKPIVAVDSLNHFYGTSSSSLSPILWASWNSSTTLGSNAGASAPVGGISGVVAIGDRAGFSSTSGADNISIGRRALFSNISGGGNVAIGQSALDSNKATGLTAVGSSAMLSNTSGTLNAAFGANAMSANTTGADNTAVGYNAMLTNTVSNDKVAVGYNAGSGNTGPSTTAVGSFALSAAGTGNNSTAVGYASAQSNTTGFSNTAIGREALKNNTVGSQNIGLGYLAGSNFSNGDGNIAIGTLAKGVAGDNNTLYIDDADNGTNSLVYAKMTATNNRWLKHNSGLAFAYVSKATSYTATNADDIIEVTATGQTITIPSGAVSGMQYTIKLTASGSCTVSAAANIDGAGTYSLSAQYKYVTITWNGSTWLVTANN